MPTPDSMVVRAKEQLSSEVADEAIVLQLGTGQYYALNCVASVIWRHIEQPASIPDLLRAIVTEFDVRADIAETDLHTVLGRMLELGLVVIN
jgi:hypothetical protein